MKRHLATCLFAALVVTGCHGFSVDTPDGFAPLPSDPSGYDYRATSAEGAVIAVRREANDPRGDLSFWVHALDGELQRRGYDRTLSEAVRSPRGVPGWELRYEVVKDGRPHVLLTRVYVTQSSVLVVEAGGDRAHFAAHASDIEHSVRNFEAS